MRSLRSERYLWIHLAGLAAVPIALAVCMLGLAAGDPILPPWLELLLLGLLGIGPILWMQLQQPFYIFSILVIALGPEQLTEQQRRILRLFKTQGTRIGAVATAIGAAVILIQLYRLAPIAAEVTPFAAGGRLLGLTIAAVAFFGSHLFLQVPVSVLWVLWQRDDQLQATEPYPLGQIRKDFTVPGIQVSQILPPLIQDTPAVRVPPGTTAAASSASTATASGEDVEPDNPWDQD
jgi:hypothetical protein